MLGARASAVIERPLFLTLSQSCEVPFGSWTAIAASLFGAASSGARLVSASGVLRAEPVTMWIGTAGIGGGIGSIEVVSRVDLSVISGVILGGSEVRGALATEARLALGSAVSELVLARSVLPVNFADIGGGPRGCALIGI